VDFISQHLLRHPLKIRQRHRSLPLPQTSFVRSGGKIVTIHLPLPPFCPFIKHQSALTHGVTLCLTSLDGNLLLPSAWKFSALRFKRWMRSSVVELLDKSNGCLRLISLEMADNTQDNMMRIAIAGSGGLARTFAQHINETVHPFIILSRQVSSRSTLAFMTRD
jgi:hypothetical protein